MNKFLRNRKDGTIYDWHPILAANPVCEEITEEEAYPERFIKPKQVERVKKTRARRKTKLDLETKDLPDDPKQEAAPEIGQDASRGLPE